MTPGVVISLIALIWAVSLVAIIWLAHRHEQAHHVTVRRLAPDLVECEAIAAASRDGLVDDDGHTKSIRGGRP